MFAQVILTLALAHAAPEVDEAYEACVKAARNDVESTACLTKAAVEIEHALTEVIAQLTRVLESDQDSKPKAKMLLDAHAKWLPSRDADCALQGAVTMDNDEDAREAAQVCVYQANVPRLRQYQRFLGFLQP